MSELDLTNTQAVIFTVVLIGLLFYLNHRDLKKSAQIKRESTREIGNTKQRFKPLLRALYSACRGRRMGRN